MVNCVRPPLILLDHFKQRDTESLGLKLDEFVFADGKVNFIGQVIGMIVAESKPLAQRAAKAVMVTYEDLPAVVTIEVENMLCAHNMTPSFYSQQVFARVSTVCIL